MVLDEFYTPSRTKPRLLDALYTIGLVRYATQKQLKSVKKSWVTHICTKQALEQLIELKYIGRNGSGAYFLLDKSFRLLGENGFNTEHLTKRLQGQGNEHDHAVTDVLLKITGEPDFFTVFYPIFTAPPNYDKDFLIPDACIVLKRDDAYKLKFLEVETPKGNWSDYLEDKRLKYQRIASDYNTWDRWWRKWSAKLNLPMCDVNDFCFSVEVIK